MYSLFMGQGPMLVEYDNGPPSLVVTNLRSTVQPNTGIKFVPVMSET